MIEKQIDKQVKHFDTNNGLEFRSNKLNTLCKSEEIQRHPIVLDMPHQNSVTDRMNRTLMEGTIYALQL